MGEEHCRRHTIVSVKVLALVEGQTEEIFIKRLLAPHLAPKSIYITPILVRTKRVVGGADYKGGITTYAKFERDL